MLDGFAEFVLGVFITLPIVGFIVGISIGYWIWG